MEYWKFNHNHYLYNLEPPYVHHYHGHEAYMFSNAYKQVVASFHNQRWVYLYCWNINLVLPCFTVTTIINSLKNNIVNWNIILSEVCLDQHLNKLQSKPNKRTASLCTKMCCFVCQCELPSTNMFWFSEKCKLSYEPTNEIIKQLSQAWFQKGNSASDIPFKIEDRIYKDF